MAEIEVKDGEYAAEMHPPLCNYIVKVFTAILDTTSTVEGDITSNNNKSKKLLEILQHRDTIETLNKFANGGESSILFVEDATSTGGDGKYSPYTVLLLPLLQSHYYYLPAFLTFTLSVLLLYTHYIVAVRHDLTRLVALSSPSTTPCMAFIKLHETPLQPQHAIHSQLQVLTLSTGDSSAGEGINSFFAQLQQLTKHLYTPMVRAAGHMQQDPSSSSSASDNLSGSMGLLHTISPTAADSENMVNLQKRFRELESALEQCQRGAIVPRIVLTIPSVIEIAAKNTMATTPLLKGYLEKYNSSQVDVLFKELGIPEMSSVSAEHIEEFVNEVGKSTKLWPAELARQTRLIESAFPSTVERELEFWRDLEKKLMETKEQLESPAVLLSKLALKRNNRVSEQLIREAEAELDRCMDVVQISTSFLRDFPLDILSAMDLSQLTRALTVNLQHFSKLKHSKYDFHRALRLFEVVGQSIFHRVADLLREKGVLMCSMDEIRRVKTQADELFATWDTQYTVQRGTFKDVAKRRKETMRALHFDNGLLQARLHALVDFREQHEKLLRVFAVVFTDGDADNDSEIHTSLHEGYQLVVRAVGDVVDVSDAGTRNWLTARQLYETKLERAEERIIRLLEDRLQTASTAEDMFRAFSMFNPLFFRPAVRNAVHSFRAVLVKNVRENVKRLQEKFRLRYDDSWERTTADLRDIPPLSGRIMWARQIEHQLHTLMQRMEDVLGVGWEEHIEGKQLKEICEELKRYLDTDGLYKDWLSTQLKSDYLVKYNHMKDFLLLIEEDPKTGKRVLRVNFDQRQVIIFKEVCYLEWLLPDMSTSHKTIPSTLLAAAHEACTRYPIATALQAALTGFAQAKTGITSSPLLNSSSSSVHSSALLLTSHIVAVREVVKEAIGGSKRTKKWIKWDSPDLNDWVGHLSNKVYALQEKVDDIIDKCLLVDTYLSRLRTCVYDRSTMLTVLEALQEVVDEVQIRGYSNVVVWVDQVRGVPLLSTKTTLSI